MSYEGKNSPTSYFIWRFTHFLVLGFWLSIWTVYQRNRQRKRLYIYIHHFVFVHSFLEKLVFRTTWVVTSRNKCKRIDMFKFRIWMIYFWSGDGNWGGIGSVWSNVYWFVILFLTPLFWFIFLSKRSVSQYIDVYFCTSSVFLLFYFFPLLVDCFPQFWFVTQIYLSFIGL